MVLPLIADVNTPPKARKVIASMLRRRAIAGRDREWCDLVWTTWSNWVSSYGRALRTCLFEPSRLRQA
jgi:hypothetical protein